MTDKKKENKKEANKEVEAIQKKLEACEKEKQEYLEGWQRAKADFSNYKKNEQERFEAFKKRNQESLITELITILDSFDLGILSSKGDTVEKKGVELIKSQLENTLSKYGLQKIKTAPGDDFDPEIHEAMERIESDKPDDSIVEVLEAGYKVGDKVVRPTKVKVSKK